MRRWLLPWMGLWLVAGGAQAACLSYTGATTVSGVVKLETFPGPPNYESVAAGDAAERVPLLRLDQPACVSAGDVEAGEVPQVEVYEIQLVLRPGFVDLDGKRVAATGQVFPATTGHHHSTVLLDVEMLSLP